MPAQLTDELHRAVIEQGDQPLEIIDPATNRRYVLLSREQYDRLKPLFEEDPLSISEQNWLLQQAGRRAGWDDVEMDDYDRYDELKSRQK